MKYRYDLIDFPGLDLCVGPGYSAYCSWFVLVSHLVFNLVFDLVSAWHSAPMSALTVSYKGPALPSGGDVSVIDPANQRQGRNPPKRDLAR